MLHLQRPSDSSLKHLSFPSPCVRPFLCALWNPFPLGPHPFFCSRCPLSSFLDKVFIFMLGQNSGTCALQTRALLLRYSPRPGTNVLSKAAFLLPTSVSLTGGPACSHYRGLAHTASCWHFSLQRKLHADSGRALLLLPCFLLFLLIN